ncbi:hypothetical protein [Leptospira santarosai]|uniref:Lipoprotein n=1 Tax=Leptospira santarosai TaxID=28183 RepID=A0AB73M879_9LEPT|nr:hypothetical protein [Leptospira santarosai]ONF94383.1 hypothetical protein BWD14_03755 [Leptospira santarosai]
MEVITGIKKGEYMKLRLLTLFLLGLFACICLTCQVGTRTDACKADLRKESVFGPSRDSCEFGTSVIFFTKYPGESDADFEIKKNTFFNFNLLNCIQYYEKLKECEKEGNRYTPALYSRE